MKDDALLFSHTHHDQVYLPILVYDRPLFLNQILRIQSSNLTVDISVTGVKKIKPSKLERFTLYFFDSFDHHFIINKINKFAPENGNYISEATYGQVGIMDEFKWFPGGVDSIQ